MSSPTQHRPPARIVVKDMVYHQVGAEQPTLLDLPGFTRRLKTDEQVYKRAMTVGEWTPLDAGWFKDRQCGMLVLENLEGHFTQVQPTVEERAEAEAKVVLLTFSNPLGNASIEQTDIVIPPRETVRFQPNDLGSIWLRCAAGRAKVQLNIFPG